MVEGAGGLPGTPVPAPRARLLLGRAEHGGAGRTAPPAQEYPGCAPALGAGRTGPWGRVFLCFLLRLFFFPKLVSLLG